MASTLPVRANSAAWVRYCMDALPPSTLARATWKESGTLASSIRATTSGEGSASCGAATLEMRWLAFHPGARSSARASPITTGLHRW